jgi:hypothetical protein
MKLLIFVILWLAAFCWMDSRAKSIVHETHMLRSEIYIVKEPSPDYLLPMPGFDCPKGEPK